MKNLAFDIGLPFFGDTTTSPSSFRNPNIVGGLVSSFLANSIVVAGILLLFLLIFGGISMISGAGDSDPQKVAQGKAAATAALLGFIIIFGAYWLIQILKAFFGIDIFPVA